MNKDNKPFEVNIPFGDGSGFNAEEIIEDNIKLEQNQRIVDELIGLDENYESKTPTEEEWSIIDGYQKTKKYPNFSKLSPAFVTPEQERDDWEYYVQNYRDDFAHRSMQDLGTVKEIKTGEDRVKKVESITGSILGISILEASSSFSFYSNSIEEMNKLYPEEKITDSTVQKYLNYKKDMIKQNYLELLEVVKRETQDPRNFTQKVLDHETGQYEELGDWPHRR